MGKYSKTLRRYGKDGFGVPSKAPNVGSFPLYPMGRAKYALTILASPNYDSKKKLRAQIAKRAISAHPSLRSYWNKLNRETIRPRMEGSTLRRRKAANPRRKNMARRKNMPLRKNYGKMRLLENPLGMELGRGQAVVVDHRGEKTPKGGWKGRVHIRKGMKDEALCGAGSSRYSSGPMKGKKRGVVKSDAKYVTCYRCIKIRVMDRGDDVERRFAGTKRSLNYMIPGGREGLYVSKKKLDRDGYPSRSGQVDGIPFFLGGTEEHPSQTRLLTKRQKAKRAADIRRGKSKKVRAGRSIVQRGEMVANPRSYGQGYDKGATDYGSMHPMPANTLRNRSMSYQEGYLEGYADAASFEPNPHCVPNPKRRKNTKRRKNAGHGVTKRFRKADGTFGYMVDGKFATKAKYDRKKRR